MDDQLDIMIFDSIYLNYIKLNNDTIDNDKIQ